MVREGAALAKWSAAVHTWHSLAHKGDRLCGTKSSRLSSRFIRNQALKTRMGLQIHPPNSLIWFTKQKSREQRHMLNQCKEKALVGAVLGLMNYQTYLYPKTLGPQKYGSYGHVQE